MLGLEGAFDGYANVISLLHRQLSQFHADLFQMQTGDFLVQMLGQDIDAGGIFIALGPQFDLRQHLVGEAGGHDKAGVAGRISKVQQAAFGQQDDAVARGHRDHIDLLFDIGPLVVFQRGDLDFVVEVADIADDRHILHAAHVFDTDDVAVAGGGDKDIGRLDDIFQRSDLKAVHCRLQRADRVDFGDDHARTGTRQRRGRALAHIAITADDGHFTSHHHIGRAADTVDQRLFTAVFVVEFRLGDAVVHVDRGERQLAFLVQIIQAMHTGRGFFGHALQRGALCGEPAGAGGQTFFDLVEQADLFFAGRHFDQAGLARLDPRADQHVKGRVTAIVEDHIRRAFGKLEDLVGIGPVFLEAFALDRKDRRAGGGDGRCGVILGRKDVAAGPAHIRAQHFQRFDQRRRLNRHMQASRDTGAFQRLALAEFLAQRHQARHFGFSDVQLLAAKIRECNIFDDVIVRHCGGSLI
ncbi:hypothetical protein KVU_2268 [Ketogulonicigenium vulgare WSH-001]|uniref:Uncharacterized protein n=1 Tax=Ketogulonicigenium vulgare (strain WSH-001) TaxID=759362 RepID=F9Y6B0_KETVW|nr:hypothetical protein KVU_2268 [Ketogulonicigenium vulgare WSH-001]